jgi:membrane dipeptidase
MSRAEQDRSLAAAGSTRPGAPADAARIHASALVVDTHVDTAQRLLDEGYDLGAPLGVGQLNLDALARGNVGAVFFALWANPDAHRADPRARVLALGAAVRAEVERHADRLVLARTAADVVAARAAGRIAILLALEGGEAIGEHLAALRELDALGVRYVGLAWNEHTALADAAVPPAPRHGGLSDLGRAAVTELNRLGIMVDVSHLSDAAAREVIRASRAPVIASHSSARALADVPRNLPDDLLVELAAKGGVVQVNFHAAFLDASYGSALHARYGADVAALSRVRAERGPGAAAEAFYALNARAARELPPPGLDALLAHVEHVRGVAGVDHVGLGSDFDGGIVPPSGIASPADLPKITAALLARGWPEEDLVKLLGGNVLRVMDTVERVGVAIRAEVSPGMPGTAGPGPHHPPHGA